MLETQERPSPESSIITIKNSKPAGKGESSGICDGSFGSKSGPSSSKSCLLCLLCLVSWLFSFLAINPQSNALYFDDTRRSPRISWRETPLLVTPHTLQSILHTTTCSRLQLAYTRGIRARSARVRGSYRCCDAKMSFQNVPSCLMSSMSAGSHCTSSSSF